MLNLETVHSTANTFSSPSLSLFLSLSSVKPLVPLLSLLENDSAHHGAHYDSQQSAQQEQEDLPAGEGRASEVPGGIVDVVCRWKKNSCVNFHFRFRITARLICLRKAACDGV